MQQIAKIFSNPVGRKIMMALTGMLLVGFVAIHLLGNLSTFAGSAALNAYAAKLASLGPLVWVFRLGLLAIFGLHIYLGIQLTMENRAAKPEGYAVDKTLRTSFAAKTMIYTGLVILAFAVYHLFHFTLQTISPEFAAKANLDASGIPDVFSMVVQGFQQFGTSAIYVVAMVTLLLHLTHGIASSFQSLGLNNGKTLPGIEKLGKGAAALFFLGYVSIPVLIFVGLVH